MEWVRSIIAFLLLAAGVSAPPVSEPVAAGEAVRAIPVHVFFSKRPEADDDWAAVFSVRRYAPSIRVATFALENLIDGPTPEEQAAGYFSELGGMLNGPSACDDRDFRIRIDDGLGTVQFCRAISSAGVGQDARVRAQVEATMRQFPTVQRVRLLDRDGHCLFDQSGLDLCLSR